ncbi:hypothetical protein JTB14_004986 [Gonioctena quinquepunctata]|nr:hypothetical protein JTB14_004986 [Gonioctena quinquepunctata]
MEEKKSVTFDEVVEVAAVKSVIHPTSSNSNLEHFIKEEPELHYASLKNRQSPHFRGRVQSGSTGDAAGLGPSTSHHVRPTGQRDRKHQLASTIQSYLALNESTSISLRKNRVRLTSSNTECYVIRRCSWISVRGDLCAGFNNWIAKKMRKD